MWRPKVEHFVRAPTWADGCFECKFGVIVPNGPENLTTLCMTRLVGLLEGTLKLCTCRAGVAYRSNLLNYQLRLIAQAKADPNMQWCTGSHPEIEAARRLLRSA